MFVDARAPNYHQLVQDLKHEQNNGRRIEVIVLQANRDGIEQISEALAKHHNLSEVHIVSHGSEGELRLGSTQLGATSLQRYVDAIAGCRQSLNGDADLLNLRLRLGRKRSRRNPGEHHRRDHRCRCHCQQ